MSFFTRMVCAALLVAALAMSGCAGTSSTAPPPGNPPATGITQNLVRRNGPPKWNIEAVGSILNAWERQTYEISDPGIVKIVGWAVDQESKAAAGGVEFVLDGVAYAATYSLSRPDVAEVYKVPAYSNSGYTFELDTRQFVPGAYTTFVRVLTSDRKGYWEVGPYKIVLK